MTPWPRWPVRAVTPDRPRSAYRPSMTNSSELDVGVREWAAAAVGLALIASIVATFVTLAANVIP